MYSFLLSSSQNDSGGAFDPHTTQVLLSMLSVRLWPNILFETASRAFTIPGAFSDGFAMMCTPFLADATRREISEPGDEVGVSVWYDAFWTHQYGHPVRERTPWRSITLLGNNEPLDLRSCINAEQGAVATPGQIVKHEEYSFRIQP